MAKATIRAISPEGYPVTLEFEVDTGDLIDFCDIFCQTLSQHHYYSEITSGQLNSMPNLGAATIPIPPPPIAPHKRPTSQVTGIQQPATPKGAL